MKYVIELDEDVKILQSISVTPNGNAYTNTQWQANLEELTTDYINEHYPTILQDAYDRGYKDGRNVTETQAHDDAYHKGLEEGNDIGYKNGVKDGQNEAWEAAKKIALMDTETSENVTGYFGLFRIMDNLTASEAIAKLKAYEKKQADKIEVGDEVISKYSGIKGIVLEPETEDTFATVIVPSERWRTHCIRHADLTKTGKHYDIEKLLEAMKND